jgi:hypothetical protein
MKQWLFLPCLLALSAVPVGCGNGSDSWQPASGVDQEFLLHEQWNDGLAEVAIYQVERNRDQYDRDTLQSFKVGTYLVKHDFDVERQSKAVESGTPSFKYSLFYSFESGGYDYRRHYVTNVAQESLRLLRSSFTSFDWCSNIYREAAVSVDGDVKAMRRTDDYGNDDWSYSLPDGVIPPEMVPVYIRSIDPQGSFPIRFSVIDLDGSTIGGTVFLASLTDDEIEYVVEYESPLPSPIGEQSDLAETYVLERSPYRPLRSITAGSERYRMELIEYVRSAYWEENVFDRLTEVSQRP